MNEESLKILFSGPAMALLLYENSRYKQDQEGFLLGDVVETRTQTITDAQGVKIKIERFIRVNSILPCPNMMYFYNSYGGVDSVKLKRFLGSSHSKVVSWYKYKQNFQKNSQRPLLFREQLLHKQLAQVFVESNSFSCCLLRAYNSENVSTYTYEQKVLCYCNKKYNTIPIHIENLSDSNDKYLKSQPMSKDFQSFISSLKLDMSKMTDNDIAMKIQKGLQHKINHSMKALTKSEVELGKMETEVLELRKRLNAQRLMVQRLREQDIKRANDSVEVVQDLINLTDDLSDRENSSPEPNSERATPNPYVNLNVIQNNLAKNVTVTRPKRNKPKENNIKVDTGRPLRKVNNASSAQNSRTNN